MKRLIFLMILFLSISFFCTSRVIADPMKHSTRATSTAVNKAVIMSVRTAFKTTANLNMRSKPEGRVIQILKKGTTVVALDNKKGSWWEISSNNKKGWVHSKYLSQ